MDITQPTDGIQVPVRAITYRPSRFGTGSAWWGHVPFGYWLVTEIRPRQIVELGTHHGVSYAAFCDAVLDDRLATRCYAVDTWVGDAHAGAYGDEVFDELHRFNAARFGAFSRLLRGTFDEALAHIPDGSTDLLHIDGLHTADAVRHDFNSWLPKLSDQGVVLFHDTNARHDDFGVWRVWDELRGRYPSFDFLHGHGLGVLAVGPRPPTAVARLCRLDGSAAAETRACFAALGERWESANEMMLLRGSAEDIAVLRRFHDDDIAWKLKQAGIAHAEELDTVRAERDRAAHERALAEASLGDMMHALRGSRREREALRFTIEDLQGELRDLLAERAGHEAARLASERAAAHTEQRIAAIFASSSWRLTAPLRRLRGWREPAAAEGGPDAPAPTVAMTPRRALRLQTARRLAGGTAPPHIVYISGEDHTPGHAYRVQRPAEAALAAGCTVATISLADIAARMEDLARASIVVIWRAPWSAETERLLRILQLNGTRFIYDIDDLMFDPALARVDVIDGIRSMGFEAAETAAFFARVQSLMQHADACTCTTTELAFQIRRFQKPAYVLPNGFDASAHALSRLALRRRRAATPDGRLRIGYAGGSRTHQRDFAQAAGAVARLLAERPEAVLVLFRSPDGRLPLVDLTEFPDLAARPDQIEWRAMVPIEELPAELARFDINLAPLETGNVFCEAKSELKYFEAALVEVCTVASPTGPLARAIRDGETGFLAADEPAFHAIMRDLLDDPARRARVAHAAYLDVLWQWGPERQAERMALFIAQVQGGPAAARGFDLDRLRAAQPAPPMPARAGTETVFAADRLGTAAATVVIPLYNYAQYVTEALDSVAAQTEAELDLVIVDDASTDDSLAVARDWAAAHAGRFSRLLVLANRANAGLGRSRNTGIDAAETPWVMLLDADNRLRPDCVARLLAAVSGSGAAFAYPSIETFGSAVLPLPAQPYQPMRLAGGNYIDAMALVAKSAWAAAGGYAVMPDGWEDYDFWCRCAERGLWGVPVAEVLADYRVHDQSMLRQTTDQNASKRRLIALMEANHPWLRIPPPE
jgi:glycosyltransferase involved in cell wall biosynthesis